MRKATQEQLARAKVARLVLRTVPSKVVFATEPAGYMAVYLTYEVDDIIVEQYVGEVIDAEHLGIFVNAINPAWAVGKRKHDSLYDAAVALRDEFLEAPTYSGPAVVLDDSALDSPWSKDVSVATSLATERANEAWIQMLTQFSGLYGAGRQRSAQLLAQNCPSVMGFKNGPRRQRFRESAHYAVAVAADHAPSAGWSDS